MPPPPPGHAQQYPPHMMPPPSGQQTQHHMPPQTQGGPNAPTSVGGMSGVSGSGIGQPGDVGANSVAPPTSLQHGDLGQIAAETESGDSERSMDQD